MQQFNIEIFDKDFNIIDNYTSNIDSYDNDYLSITINEVRIWKISKRVKNGQYIRLSNSFDEFIGIICELESLENDVWSVKFKSILSIFDIKILFDTDLQGGAISLEQMLINEFNKLYSENEDLEQNIRGFKTIADSNTNNWGFNLKSDVEQMHHCIINLFETLIVRSFIKYEIVVTPVIDVFEKKLEIRVGRVDSAQKIIEADLPNVFNKKIIIQNNDKSVNKLIVYNDAGFTQKMTYYLHTDGTFDTNNSDRITPVLSDIKYVRVDENNTFEKLAKSQAVDVFSQSKNNNLIELEILNEDRLVDVKNMKIGQTCQIVANETIYTSILSGKRISNTTVLVFGTVRIELTKKLRRAVYGD